VAVKELHATNSVQSNAEMFGEAETLNSLRHPCIIAFYGVVVNQVPMHHLLYCLEIMPTQLYSAGHVYQTVLCTGYVYRIVLSSVLSTSCLPLHHLSHILPLHRQSTSTDQLVCPYKSPILPSVSACLAWQASYKPAAHVLMATMTNHDQ